MKTRKIYHIWLTLLILSVSAIVSLAQEEPAVGLIQNAEGALDGYTLAPADEDQRIYLLDNDGRLINQWDLDRRVREAHLLPNGNIMVATRTVEGEVDNEYWADFRGATGTLFELTWDGEIVWEYSLDDPKLLLHHGISIMPNGNILIIAWSYRTLDEALEKGLNVEIYGDSDYIAPDVIYEIDYETKEIVWAWDTWDHTIQNFDAELPNYGEPVDNPGRIDINYHELAIKNDGPKAQDWLHTNAVDYNPELDQILVSVRRFDEVWIIDHDTTTEEAAGPAGDILYRWGNDFAYGATDNIDERVFYNQHDVQWVDAGNPGEGNLILFNNREVSDSGEFSAIVEFTPSLNADGTYTMTDGVYGPEDVAWRYAADGFFSRNISGVQRLPNGNTLIIEGRDGRVFEVTPEGEVVWNYVVPSETVEERVFENVFRARKYPADHPGFEGHDLTPGDYLVEN